MNTTVRIYGNIVNTWKAWEPVIIRGQYQERERITQYEIEYTEYDMNGNVVATGTEDFSAERYNTTFKSQEVYTWDGKKLNKGGHRWFEYRGFIRYNASQRKALNQYLKNKYNEAELVQLRNI